jgi:hypothetical protein
MAIPQYQRTVIRQVQATDMSEGNVWRELANTLDNFSSQINRTTQNIVASEKNKAIAKQKADLLARKNYLDSMESSIIEAAHQASINNPNDFVAYTAEFDAKTKIWLESETLNSMSGARELLTTMIGKKRQHYGEKPYEATQLKIKTDGIADAQKNLNTDVNDYIHQAGVSLDLTNNPTIDMDVEGLINTNAGETLNQWNKMTAKINDLVTLNGHDVEAAIALEVKMQEKYIAGVIGKQIAININNGNGVAAMSEFYTNPNKFIRMRKDLSAFFPEGVKVSEELKLTIYDELNKYLGDFNKAETKREKEADDNLTAQQLDSFVAYKSGLQTGSDLNKDDLRIAFESEIIDGPQYNELLEDLATGKYEEEDEMVKWQLLQDMLNPALSEKDKVAAISQALAEKTIDGTSAGTYLTKAYSANKASSQEGYSLANGAIGRAFGLSESGDWFGDSGGMSKEDAANMRYAQEELLRRVGEGEVPIEIYNEIIEKYTDNAAGEKLPLGTIGNHAYADSYTMKSGFNTYFVGTPKITEGGATTLKIGKDLDEGLITEAEATRLSKSLKAYIKIQRGLN